MSPIAFLLKDMDRRGVRVYATRRFADDGVTVIGYNWKLQRRLPEPNPRPEDWDDVEWADDWETSAGTMVDAVREMRWAFVWGVFGKLTGHDWLECDLCGQVQMCRKAAGTASARKKCIMTHRCGGYMRRMPEVFEVVKKNPPKKRRPKDPNAQRRTRGHSQEIKDEALALVDAGKSQSEAARIMAARHPETCAKLTVSTISTWKLARNRALQAKVA